MGSWEWRHNQVFIRYLSGIYQVFTRYLPGIYQVFTRYLPGIYQVFWCLAGEEGFGPYPYHAQRWRIRIFHLHDLATCLLGWWNDWLIMVCPQDMWMDTGDTFLKGQGSLTVVHVQVTQIVWFQT